jgi:hypothetical protein
MDKLSNRLSALAEKASARPWAYRPCEYDDWGVIKGPPERPDGWEYDLHPHLAQFRHPDFMEDAILSAHRSAKTDPWRGNAELVVELVNALPTIISALQKEDM